MKLIKSLFINGQKAELESEEIRLCYMQPGTAIFQIRTGAEPDELTGAMLRFSMGWNVQNSLTMFFSGFVSRPPVRAGKGVLRLFCREMAASLDNILPLSLRHPTLDDVLKAYAALTGLRFSVPQKAYAKTRIAAFYTLGSGFHGLQNLGAAFSIPGYFWQCLGDGSVFVGAYADSAWAAKPVKVPDEYFTGAAADGTRHLAAIPALRPGVSLNGRVIRELTFKGANMEATCC